MADEPVKAARAPRSRQRPVKLPEVMEFSRQMASFLEAGIPIMDALETVSMQVGTPSMAAVVNDLLDQGRRGEGRSPHRQLDGKTGRDHQRHDDGAVQEEPVIALADPGRGVCDRGHFEIPRFPVSATRPQRPAGRETMVACRDRLSSRRRPVG